jgi:hypothetical protein
VSAASTPDSVEEQLLDTEIGRVARALGKAGKRLGATGRDGVDDALMAVADVRQELERIERELVSLARRTGRSWAQIGADLNIIIPQKAARDVPVQTRYARRRRAVDGNGRHRT